MKLFNNTFEVIERSMDLRFRRHALLSSNIANSETPGYRARELDFAGELEHVLGQTSSEEVQKTDTRHMDLATGSVSHVVMDDSGAMGADGNNVDLDISMGKMAENARAYQNAANWLGVQLRLIKTAARGRAGA